MKLNSPDSTQNQIEKDLLQENNLLLLQNNHLLRQINRFQRWVVIMKLLWLVIFVGVPVILYHLSYPHISNFWSDFESNLETVFGLRATPALLPSEAVKPCDSGQVTDVPCSVEEVVLPTQTSPESSGSTVLGDL